MTEYTFNQLVDIEQLRQLLESHHGLSGMAYCLFDMDENNLFAMGAQDICVRYHRVNPVSCVYCRESDAYINEHLHTFQGDFLEYRCKNGMIEIAVPIIIDGEHMATLFTGQFFYDDDLLDMEFFLAQAWTLGFDPEGYLKALEDVPVFSREHVRDNMLFLRNMVALMAEMGLRNLKRARQAEKHKLMEEVLAASERTFRTLVENLPYNIVRYDRKCHAIYLNPMMMRSLHLELADILGKTPVEALGDEMKEYEDVLRSVLKTGVPDEFELSLLAPSGALSIHTIRFVAERDQSGEITGVLAIGRDITEREQTLNELLKGKDAESLGALAGGIAHDFNRDIRAINPKRPEGA